MLESIRVWFLHFQDSSFLWLLGGAAYRYAYGKRNLGRWRRNSDEVRSAQGFASAIGQADGDLVRGGGRVYERAQTGPCGRPRTGLRCGRRLAIGSTYVEQEQRLGTGHAVMQARNVLPAQSDAVLVTYGDMPLLRGETLAELVITL